MNLEDRQSEVEDIKRLVESLRGDLDSAESCETESDFNENLAEALAQVKAIQKAIKELQGSAS